MNGFEKNHPEENSVDVQSPANNSEQEAPRNAYDNPRIKALVEARDKAERALQEAILDIETREQDPAYITAKEMFDKGVRIFETREYTDSDYKKFEYRVPGYDTNRKCTIYDIGYKINGAIDLTNAELLSGEDTGYDDLLTDLSIGDKSNRWEIVRYLIDLTIETR